MKIHEFKRTAVNSETFRKHKFKEGINFYTAQVSPLKRSLHEHLDKCVANVRCNPVVNLSQKS